MEEISKRLQQIFEKARNILDEKDRVREEALRVTREVTRLSGEAIRMLHRGEFEDARSKIAEAEGKMRRLKEMLAEHMDIYHEGYVQMAYQELAEACILYSLMKHGSIPLPEEIDTPYVPYILALGDVIGELRRAVLDSLRRGDFEKGEWYFAIMEEIFSHLVTLDYPDALIPGHRRKCDIARGVLEKMRGDLFLAVHREKSIKLMEELLKRLTR